MAAGIELDPYSRRRTYYRLAFGYLLQHDSAGASEHYRQYRAHAALDDKYRATALQVLRALGRAPP